MIPEDLLFWIAALGEAPSSEHNLLCRRHADAMVVPRGWTLDDRREDTLRLFKPKPGVEQPHPSRPRRRRSRSGTVEVPEQLQIDGTGETVRPVPTGPAGDRARGGDPGAAPRDVTDDRADPADVDHARAGLDPDADVAPPWQPDFDAHDDLDGLLEVTSPLLARAFRGTGRPRP